MSFLQQAEEYDSDSSDEDFVPEGDGESDGEPLSGVEDSGGESGGEDGDNKKTKKKGSRKNKKKADLKKQNPLLAHLGEEENENVETEWEPKSEEKEKEKEKEKANSLWADFLDDVEEKPAAPPKPKASSWGALLGKKSSVSSQSSSIKQFDAFKKETKKNVTETPTSNTVKITQVFEFAGEEIRVEKEVDANSKEAKVAELKSQGVSSDSKSPSAGAGGIKRPAGLSSIMGLIDSKKQKLTVLDKTAMDWKSYKSNLGIEEELESHKKSKDGFLEKQDFLDRADHRQFEIEKSMRLGKRSNR